MSANTLVSVIIPTYNRAFVVSRAIDSVLAQTYQRIEIIVVDDGSTDATQATLKTYGNKIRVLQQANSGPAAARNRGIAAAQGEVLAFLDSDDYWLPSKIERQVCLLDQAGSAIACCICDCTVAYDDGNRTSAFQIADTLPSYPESIWLNVAEVLTSRFVLFNQAVAVRREVLERVGYFDEALRLFCEDYELALRLALEGPWAVIRDELVVYQDASPGSLGKRALREQKLLCEHQVHMRKRILEIVEGDSRYSRLRDVSRRELRRAARNLTAARWLTGERYGSSLLGRGLQLMERIRKAIFRRSPLYPHMLVREIAWKQEP